MSWHTLMLVGGGNVLGKAVSSSGLLGYLSDAITLGNFVRFSFYLCYFFHF